MRAHFDPDAKPIDPVVMEATRKAKVEAIRRGENERRGKIAERLVTQRMSLLGQLRSGVVFHAGLYMGTRP